MLTLLNIARAPLAPTKRRSVARPRRPRNTVTLGVPLPGELAPAYLGLLGAVSACVVAWWRTGRWRSDENVHAATRAEMRLRATLEAHRRIDRRRAEALELVGRAAVLAPAGRRGISAIS